jgi:hypothetical protein
LNPFGRRGGSSAVAALRRGHGAPAPPQVHAGRHLADQGGSQIQPLSSQRRQSSFDI